MKPKPVLVVIGAASITFTPKLLRDMVHHPALGGSTIRLVDIDEENLRVMARIAEKVNLSLDTPWKIETTTDRRDALPGADYIIISVDVARNETWDSDWRIPVSHGIRQVTGELGGPGGLFHSLRQIPLHVEMARDIAELCPDALVMVESNPLNRICLAMTRFGGLKNVMGLCHGVEITQWALGRVLGHETDELLATAAGTNHFTWILDLRLQASGDDLYPALRDKLKAYKPDFWALSRKMFDVYGFFPSCGDDHIGEYLAFAWEIVGMEGPQTADREEGAQGFRRYLRQQAASDGPLTPFTDKLGGGHDEEKTDFFFTPRSWVDTLAFPIMDSLQTNKLRRMPAVNMINNGAVRNLPADVFVEGPAMVDSSGCRLVSMGDLPKPLAAFCRRDVDQMEAAVHAAMSGSRNAVLQAVLLDPVVDSISAAEKTVDEMLKANAPYLPGFK